MDPGHEGISQKVGDLRTGPSAGEVGDRLLARRRVGPAILFPKDVELAPPAQDRRTDERSQRAGQGDQFAVHTQITVLPRPLAGGNQLPRDAKIPAQVHRRWLGIQEAVRPPFQPVAVDERRANVSPCNVFGFQYGQTGVWKPLAKSKRRGETGEAAADDDNAGGM